jgi:thioredoxin-related protein
MAGASDKINWHSYDEGVALSKQEGKKMFIHFYADWCAYCKKMDKETLSNSAVIDSLNQNFIPVLVNSDLVNSGKDRELVNKFYVRGLPSSWFVSETGEKISNLPGFVSAEKLLNALKFFYTDSYKKMSFKEFINSGS